MDKTLASPVEPTEPIPDTAWWYRGGEWERGPRLIDWDAHPELDSFARAAAAAGFDVFTSTGNEEVSSAPLHIQVFVRHEPDEAWAIRIDADCAEEVYTSSLPDTMALLAQWAPTLQSLNFIAPSRLVTMLATFAVEEDRGYGPELDAIVRRIVRAAR